MTAENTPTATITVEPTNDSDDRSRISSDDDSANLKTTRRATLVTLLAGAFTISGETALADEDGVQMTVDDVGGANHEGVPQRFALGPNTSFTVGWSGVIPGERIYITVAIRPDSGDFEDIAEADFIASDQSGERELEGSDLFSGPSERDLTQHSEISADMFATDEPETIEHDFELQVKTESAGETLSQESAWFTAIFAKKSGAGMDLGQNLGLVYPPDFPEEFRDE